MHEARLRVDTYLLDLGKVVQDATSQKASFLEAIR